MTASSTSTVSPRQYRWLLEQAEQWQHEGLIDTSQREAIAHRYTPSRRFEVVQIVLGLGASFVGIGLIWLVATNYDQLSPLVRFAMIAALWLALLGIGERLSDRRAGVLPQTVRGLAALCFGAVIFQAAQSLQVPAYAPHLLGLWALGAFAHAYLTRAAGPFIVGLVVSSLWLQYQIFADVSGPFDVVQPLALAAIVCVGLAGAHRHLTGFGLGWREVGFLFALLALFVATLPVDSRASLNLEGWQLGLFAAAIAAAIAGAVLGERESRPELLGVICLAVVSFGIALWPGSTDISAVGPLDWARTAVSIAAFLLAAAGIAVAGVLRESWRLTVIAFAGLVLFTTVQAFAVIGPIVSGAWLFLVVGLILMVVGTLGESGRRELTRRFRRRLAQS